MTTKIRSHLLNVFSPAIAAGIPQRFAGRKKQIAELTDALHVDGACPAIFGDRGLGKSSLALQLERIALGDVELLDSLDLTDRAVDPDDAFVTVRVACTDGIGNKQALLQCLINSAEGFASLDDLPRQPGDKSVKHTLKLKVYQREVVKQFTRREARQFANLSIEEQLLTVVDRVTEKTGRRVLCIIDELDRVDKTVGLASFIKSHSSDRLRFLLVGVGGNVSFLLADHESLQRSLVPVRVGPMRDKELMKIIDLAQLIVRFLDVDLQFSHSAKEQIVALSNGVPWFVHVIGQGALINAHERGSTEVTLNDVDKVLHRLTENRFMTELNDLYLRAVGDSARREIVLRLMARWPQQNVPVSEIYQVARHLGINNPSQNVQELLKIYYGRVLSRSASRDRGLYYFRNSMFKRFVAMRGTVYEGVGEKISSGWKEILGEG